MKPVSLLSVIAVALLAGVWLLAGAPAALAASGSAWPTQATPGTRVHFSASGFTPGERMDLWASAPSGATRPRYPSVIADAAGSAVWSWDVAAGDPNGDWTMSARGVTSGALLAIPFAVVGSEAVAAPITVSPASGAPGTLFTFQASGLTPGRRVSAWLVQPDGASRDLVPGEDAGLKTDDAGALSWSWTAPADAAGGTWQMVLRDSSAGRELTVAFTVVAPPPAAPLRNVTPAAGAPGTTFTVTVDGFVPGEQVGSWLRSPSGRAVDATPYLLADDRGVVTWSWNSPPSAQAGEWVAVTQARDSRREVALPFTIGGANPAPAGPQQPYGSVSPTEATPGDVFTFEVNGFGQSELVAFWPTQPDGTVETTRREPFRVNGAGHNTLEWQAPGRAQSGVWTMTFRGQNSGRELRVRFTIRADASVPASVSPASGTPGTTFTFQSGGFNVIERLDTWLERPDGTLVDGPLEVRADGAGVATWSWVAPSTAPGGQWTMVGQGQDTDLIVRIGFMITDGAPQTPPASVSPERGGAGTTFTFTASGYEYGERVGYWLTLPDGSIQRFDKELRADKEGRVVWSYTARSGAARGIYVMAARSSQSDDVDNDVSYAIRFTVE
jgi:hypothetical protein